MISFNPKLLLAFISLSLLSACAIPVDGNNMSITPDIADQISTNPALKDKIRTGDVIINKDAQTGVFQVTPTAVATALDYSLVASGYRPRGADAEEYLLNARLIKVGLPGMAFDVELDIIMDYQLVRAKDGHQVFAETVRIPYVQSFSSSFDGTQRFKMAIENGIRENITHFIRVLSSANIQK